ncbi:MAG: GNAT family N-acetyltransferase [Candidatus Omnitrophica bacterium]|nr:GNAT family N-acetyltransferase [Candidatus Omnitrophota bacterium]
METKIINQYEDFVGLKDDWHDLLARDKNSVFFLTFEWLNAWWKNYGSGQELFIILALDSGRILGAAPLMIKSTRFRNIVLSRKLQFIAHEVSDYMDFVIPSQEKEVYALIFETIKKNMNLWDWAEFSFIRDDSAYFKDWLYAAKDSVFLKTKISADDVAVAIHMYKEAGSYDELEKRLPNQERLRRVLRKKRNKFLREIQGASFRRTKDFTLIKEQVGSFAQQHCKRLQVKGLKSQFEDQRYASYFLDVARDISPYEQGLLSTISRDGESIAMAFGFIYNNRYYHYLSNFNERFSKYSPSELLVRFMLESFYEEGKVKKFDFLRGGERYKFDWSKEKLSLFTIQLYPKRLKGAFCYAAVLMKNLFAPLLQHLSFLINKIREKTKNLYVRKAF